MSNICYSFLMIQNYMYSLKVCLVFLMAVFAFAFIVLFDMSYCMNFQCLISCFLEALFFSPFLRWCVLMRMHLYGCRPYFITLKWGCLAQQLGHKMALLLFPSLFLFIRRWYMLVVSDFSVFWCEEQMIG